MVLVSKLFIAQTSPFVNKKCPGGQNPPGQGPLVGQILLVGFDHLLESVTRTTSEFFKVAHGGLAGENLNIQTHNPIRFRRNEDFVNKFVGQFVCNV